MAWLALKQFKQEQRFLQQLATNQGVVIPETTNLVDFEISFPKPDDIDSYTMILYQIAGHTLTPYLSQQVSNYCRNFKIRTWPIMPGQKSLVLQTREQRELNAKRFLKHWVEPKPQLTMSQILHHSKQLMQQIDLAFSGISPPQPYVDWKWHADVQHPGAMDSYVDQRGFRPISRGYFKLFQIITTFKPDLSSCLCLGQGSGGFVQAIYNFAPDASVCASTLAKQLPNLLHPYLRRIVKGQDYRMISAAGGDHTKQQYIHQLSYAQFTTITCDACNNSTSTDREKYQRNLIQTIPRICHKTLVNDGSLIIKMIAISQFESMRVLNFIAKQFRMCSLYKPVFSNPRSTQIYVIFTGYGKGSSSLRPQQLLQHITKVKDNWVIQRASGIMLQDQLKRIRVLFPNYDIARGRVKQLNRRLINGAPNVCDGYKQSHQAQDVDISRPDHRKIKYVPKKPVVTQQFIEIQEVKSKPQVNYAKPPVRAWKRKGDVKQQSRVNYIDNLYGGIPIKADRRTSKNNNKNSGNKPKTKRLSGMMQCAKDVAKTCARKLTQLKSHLSATYSDQGSNTPTQKPLPSSEYSQQQFTSDQVNNQFQNQAQLGKPIANKRVSQSERISYIPAPAKTKQKIPSDYSSERSYQSQQQQWLYDPQSSYDQIPQLFDAQKHIQSQRQLKKPKYVAKHKVSQIESQLRMKHDLIRQRDDYEQSQPFRQQQEDYLAKPFDQQQLKDNPSRRVPAVISEEEW